ncbi:MAG TPA: DUF6350 family protein [Streptosporangiaceae bacterium]
MSEGRSRPRPLAVTGVVGAAWCVGIGLASLTTITLIGWVAGPRGALGTGLPDVFRTAVNFWLVAHHAGYSVPHGRVGLLPLGLMVLPGALLYRSGGWIIRTADAPDGGYVGVVPAALSLAVPYSVLAGLLALAARGAEVVPSAWQALLVGFLLAVFAGGFGAARAVVRARGRGRVRSGLGALLRLLPERPRSLAVGVAGATAVLVASGAVLAGLSLAVHLRQAGQLYEVLAPGVVGGVLLFLVEVVFLPNAVIWAMAYAIGPGFSVGTGTSVSPTGVFLDVVPSFPPLAALPEPGPAPALSLLALAAPFLAGIAGGALTVRVMPSPVPEAAPLWGFVSGALTACVAAGLAALAGGPLGGQRLATMGPSAWQVGFMAALEVGVSAAIAAWAMNYALLRRVRGPDGATRPASTQVAEAGSAATAEPADRVEFVDPEPVLGAGRRGPDRPEKVETRGGAIYILRDDPPGR